MKRGAGLAILGASCGAMLLGACATTHRAPPDALPTPAPANARVKLYSACVAAADRAGTVQKFGRLIRFTCEGAPAHALFDGLAPFSLPRGWETTGDGVIVRRASVRTWDDQCAASPATAPAAWSCRLHMAVGDFLNPGSDAAGLKPKR